MRRKSLILIAVIVLLVVYLFARPAEHLNYDLPVWDAPEKDKITKISYGGKETVSLVKKDDKWFLEGSRKADSGKINTILNGIKKLEATDLVSDSQVYKQYGLDDDEKTSVCVTAGDRSWEFQFGNKSGTGTRSYGMFGSDKGIYLITGDWNKLLPDDPAELRDKFVLSFDRDGINRMVLKDNVLKSSKTFEKKDDKWFEDGEPLKDSAKLEGVITTLSNFKCQSFADGRTMAESPHWELSLSSGDENSRVSVWDDKDGKFLCRSSQSDDLFFVSPAALKEIEGLF